MYDTFSEDYDRFVNWEARLAFEIPFIEQHLTELRHSKRTPVQVLDAACGTGIHAIELARRGFHTSGADLSAGMIQKASSNAQAACIDIHLEAVGFGKLSETFGESKFDALLCLGNSLPHLLDPSEIATALSDFARCLRRGGFVLIQNRNFDSVMRERQRWMEPQSHKEGEDEWVFIRFYDYEANGLINFNVISIKRQGQGAWKQRVISSLMRPQLNSELTNALHKAGFGDLLTFGSLGGEKYDSLSSGNLVILAYKD
jgi:glycine/sarcosine N-methyltransferase